MAVAPPTRPAPVAFGVADAAASLAATMFDAAVATVGAAVAASAFVASGAVVAGSAAGAFAAATA